MESSDDSFTWGNASSTTEENDDIAVEMINGKEGGFESDTDYKNKLHKKLFKKPENSDVEVKRELLAAVKKEPESGEERANKKKSRKNNQIQVKQELQNDITIKNETSPETKTIKTSTKSKADLYDTIYNGHEIIDEVELPHHKRKAKKKKSKHKHSSEDIEDNANIIVEDKFSAKETLVEKPRKRLLSNNNRNENDQNHAEHSISTKKRKKSTPEGNSLPLNYTGHQEYTHHTSKISDFIQFEEEMDVPIKSSTELLPDTSMTERLKTFLRRNAHAHLQPVTCKSNEQPFISQNDDIWLLNCPSEIDIKSIKDSDLSLDTKCKIKIDNQTFVGNLDNKVDLISVLCFDHSKAILKNMSLNGTIKLHKRIPKAHIFEDNLILNNQTDFIPLPETKCRHPLFGSDYKKAMRICSFVKARLKDNAESMTLGEKKKKKIYKKENKSEEAKEKSEEESEIMRKRKITADDEEAPVSKKRRRRVQEPAAFDTWDSEKAIEKSLFNF